MPSGGLLRDAAALLLRMRTKRECSYFVLDFSPNFGYNIRISAHRGARSRGVVIVEPGAVLRMRPNAKPTGRRPPAHPLQERCGVRLKKPCARSRLVLHTLHTAEPDASSRLPRPHPLGAKSSRGHSRMFFDNPAFHTIGAGWNAPYAPLPKEQRPKCEPVPLAGPLSLSVNLALTTL